MAKKELTPELQIAGLQDELKKAVGELSDAKKVNQEQAAELEQLKNQLSVLQGANDDLSGKLKLAASTAADSQTEANLKKEVEGLKSLNAELLLRIETLDQKAQEGKLPVLTINGEKYENTMPGGFNLPGKGVVTHAELAKDKELQARLVEIRSGVLRKKV